MMMMGMPVLVITLATTKKKKLFDYFVLSAAVDKMKFFLFLPICFFFSSVFFCFLLNLNDTIGLKWPSKKTSGFL